MTDTAKPTYDELLLRVKQLEQFVLSDALSYVIGLARNPVPIASIAHREQIVFAWDTIEKIEKQRESIWAERIVK